jgi:hypothetical protein
MLLTFITPVEIGLSIGFFSTLAGSLWFCLKNYAIETRMPEHSPHGTEQ